MKPIFKFAILSTLLFGITSNAECMWRKKSDFENEFRNLNFKKSVKRLCEKVEGNPNPTSTAKSEYILKYEELILTFEKEKENLNTLDIKVAEVRLNHIKDALKIKDEHF